MKPASLLALCIGFWSCVAAAQSAVPQAPSEDFQEVRAAIRGATSWRVTGTRPVLVNGLPGGLLRVDVAGECPNRELVTLGEGSQQVRFAVVGDETWESTDGPAEARWERVQAGAELGRPPCAHDTLAGRQMRPETAWSPGITVVRGTLCRVWHLAFYDENDVEIEGVLCAGPDNLPLEVSYSDGLRLIFVDWGHTDVDRLLARTTFRDLMLRSGGPLTPAKAP